jgi:chromosome segregation ATPase
VNGSNPKHANESQREELEQASSLLEKEIDEMIERESEVVTECASLRRKMKEMGQALAAARAALARENETRAAAEREHAKKLSGLQSALEHERHEWQRQLKSRDDSLKVSQKQLDAKSQLLQTHQAAIVELRDTMVALEQQRAASEKSLSEAREEAAMQREARLAAEERAKAAAEAQKSLEQQLLQEKDLEQRMQAHLASMSSLRSKLANRAIGHNAKVGSPALTSAL